MSLQYLKKEVIDEVDFFACRLASNFPASRFQHFVHQSFLQGNTIVVDGQGTSILKVLVFCMQINFKVSTSLDYRFW